jgi:hypothetical protein
MSAVEDDLGRVLARYLDAIRLEFLNRKAVARPADARLAVLITEDQILVRAVEQAEKGHEFQDLVRETASLYYPEGLTRGSLGKLAQQVAEFFRLSGVYCDLFDGRDVQPEDLRSRFQTAFEAKSQTVTYYAPIEWVYFGKEAICAGEFEIRRLTEIEMEAIFSDRIRRVFYPWARVNTKELAGYWFLIAREAIGLDRPGATILRLNVRVDPHRPRFSPPIDRALSLLALGDWTARRPLPASKPRQPVGLDTSQWPLPEMVPFVISVPANPLEWPRRAPDTSVLNRIDDIDPETRETFEHPNFQVHWDAAKVEQFERVLASALRAMNGIRRHQQEWAFMDVALRFLGRAFTSEGIESLLWNMTAVDALLGEDKGGAKARLSGRVRKLLGEPQKERFEALYEIRSDLVHGNAKFKHKVLLDHLATARELARLSALWMLRYLACIAQEAHRSGLPVPTRGDLLAILDGNQAARQRCAAVAAVLPRSFPKVTEWLDASGI